MSPASQEASHPASREIGDPTNQRGPLPLAVRLAIMLTVLAALVLVLAGIALTTLLNSFLLNRLDDQLVQTAQVATTLLNHDRDDLHLSADGSDQTPPATPGSIRTSDSLPNASIAAIVTRDVGTLIVTGPKAPAVSATVLADVANSSPGYGEPWTYSLDGADYRWLVTNTDDRYAITGVPLDPVEQTTERLIVLMAIVGAIALIGVAGGGYFVVRRGLRPLGRLAAGARAIAGSDLGAPAPAPSRETPLNEPGRTRLELTPERSSAEVVELSTALSTMLDEIDRSIEARDIANERLRRFVADASHELRTPLASIRAYSELLRRGVYSDEAQSQQFLRRIEAESIRLGTLVNDLLLLARLDQGRALAQEPVDILAVIDEAVSDLSAADPGRTVEVVVADGTKPVIIGDPDRLRQVFSNLLANVRVHTPTSAPLTISVQNVEHDLVIEIADSGPGIPPEALDSIFDRFFRADSGRSRDKGGSGLGLAIVRSVVQAHGGSVELASSAAGTTVHVILPVNRSR